MTPVTAFGRPPRLPLLECAVPYCTCRNRVPRCARDGAGLTVYEAGAGGPRIMWDDVLNEWGPSGMPPAAGPTKLNWTGYHPKLDPAPLKRPKAPACECGSSEADPTHYYWCPAREVQI